MCVALTVLTVLIVAHNKHEDKQYLKALFLHDQLTPQPPNT